MLPPPAKKLAADHSASGNKRSSPEEATPRPRLDPSKLPPKTREERLNPAVKIRQDNKSIPYTVKGVKYSASKNVWENF